MNVYVQRTVSLFLIVLVSFLGFDYFQIISLASVLRNCFYVITFILLVVSSTAVVCSGAALVHKIINYAILFLSVIGLTLSALSGALNILIYVVILFAFCYSCYDMVVRK